MRQVILLLGFFGAVLLLALVPTRSHCADPLLDVLERKGTLSPEEVKQIEQERQEAEKAQVEALRDEILPKALKGLEIGTLSYFEYSGGREKDDKAFNRFRITRGYIIVKKQLTPWLGFRVTPDVTQDDTGDFKLRLKYLYAEIKPPDLGFLTDMKSEIGMGHNPWLDFEEHVNFYRVQGTMFIERAGIFNSADLGVSVMGYWGGQMDEDFRKRVSKYYAGRWGSWHIGVYNGGGYHAKEENENKIPEVRLTVRPLPDLLPGLQVSYFGLFGKGNKKNVSSWPDYDVNLAMLSYQDSWITFTGQYARTRGNNKGTLVVPGTDRSLKGEGFSFFVEGIPPLLDRAFSVIGRYDRFDPDTEDWVASGKDAYELALGGLAWRFYPHWMALLVYERIFYEKNNGGLGAVPSPGKDLDDDWRVQGAVQMSF